MRLLPNYLLLLAGICLASLPAMGQGKRQAVPSPAPSSIKAPASHTGTADSLGVWFKGAYPEQEARIKALYAWMLANLHYEPSADFEFAATRADESRQAHAALQKRKGDAGGMAAVFARVCGAMGLEAYVVPGYARRQGMVGHAWVAVRSAEGYFLYDPAWDMDLQAQKATKWLGWAWFRKDGEAFIHTHMPFDPMWQLRPTPIGYAGFDQGKFAAAPSSAPPFAFADSIAAYRALPEVGRLQAAYRRMGKPNGGNLAIGSYANLLRGNVWAGKQNNLAAVLDSATGAENAFIADWNLYAQHYNNRFAALADSTLRALMARMRSSLASADKDYAYAITLTTDPAQRTSIATDRKAVDDNISRLTPHEAFVSNYLSKTRVGREMIWMEGNLPP